MKCVMFFFVGKSNCRTPHFLLPPHLIVQVFKLLEEVVDFAALIVSLRGGEHSDFGLLSQVLADVGYWEHNLLHSAVMTHNLGQQREAYCGHL